MKANSVVLQEKPKVNIPVVFFVCVLSSQNKSCGREVKVDYNEAREQNYEG